MIAVDASLAAKWIFAEDYSDKARGLLRSTLQAAEPILAASFLPVEVTNVIRQRMRKGELDLPEALSRLTAFLAIPVTLQAPNTLHRRALELASEHNLPAVYDAHYVALAELRSTTLWTDDQRLLNAVRSKLTFVRWIGDYMPEHESNTVT